MGDFIDINSMDPNWKKYAEAADNAERNVDQNYKGDGKFNLKSVFEKLEFIKQAKADSKTDEEIKAFFSSQEDSITHAKLVDMDEINELFQLDLSNKNVQRAIPNDRSIRRANEATVRDITNGIASCGNKYFVTGTGNSPNSVDYMKMADALVEYYNNDETTVDNKEYYKKLSSEVKKVAELMKDVNYASRSDVEKIYDEVNAKLQTLPKDEFSDFRNSILKSFVILAETHQKEVEKNKLESYFKEELRRNQGLSREEAYKKIKADPNFKGSYYESGNYADYTERFKDEAKAGFDEKPQEYVHEGLISQMKSGVILEDARREVYDAIWAQRDNISLTSSKDIEDAIERLIHQDRYTDKIMHKNLRGEMSFKERITGERSVYKDIRKAVATYNRVQANKLRNDYTRDDFYKDAFKGKAGDAKFNQLVSKGLLTQIPAVDKDGNPLKDKNGNQVYTYNLAKLADIIERAISPADLRANYGGHTDPQAEIITVIGDIKAETGVEISYKDCCHLIDMCGFERDKWNVGYVLATVERAAVDTVSDMAASAATALMIGAIQGDPVVSVTDAIFHVTDPTAHAETNIDAITKALLSMSAVFGQINPDNGMSLTLDLRINVKVNGENIDINDAINDREIRAQLRDQLGDLNLPSGSYGFRAGSDGYWHLWVDIPSDAPYDDVHALVEGLGANFDLRTSTGVDFEANAVIDSKGEVVVDKPAEANVEDKGKASTSKKWQSFLWGTAIGFGLNLIRECLAGLPMTDESILNTQVTADTYEKYAAQLSSEPLMKSNTRLRDAILRVAKMLYEKGGKEAYEEFLQEIAGHRSKLNRKELEIGILKYMKEHEPVLEPKTPPAEETPKTEIKPPVEEPVVKTDENEHCVDCNELEDTEKIPPHEWHRQGGETWENIVKAKYPSLVQKLEAKAADLRAQAKTLRANGDRNGAKRLEDEAKTYDMYGRNGAIKVMQRALATDENGQFHADEFKGITGGDIPKTLMFPDEIYLPDDEEACKYADDSVEKLSQNRLTGSGGSISRNDGSYGHGRTGHTFTEDCNPNVVGHGSTPERARADYQRRQSEQ